MIIVRQWSRSEGIAILIDEPGNVEYRLLRAFDEGELGVPASRIEFFDIQVTLGAPCPIASAQFYAYQFEAAIDVPELA